MTKLNSNTHKFPVLIVIFQIGFDPVPWSQDQRIDSVNHIAEAACALIALRLERIGTANQCACYGGLQKCSLRYQLNRHYRLPTLRFAGDLDMSHRFLDIQIDSLAARHMAMYSASQEDKAAHVCFLDLQLAARSATKNNYPLEDFLEFLNPAQSELK